MNQNCELTVIMPALNEEKNILLAINNTLKSLEEFNILGEIIVVNDGSRDRVGELVKDFMQTDDRVRIINHKTPQGIGSSFWDGVDSGQGKAVVLLPGDNENNPWEIFRYFRLLEHVDIVVPFVFNKEVRSLFRNALSYVYRFITNTTFLVNFNYTNGTVLYRKSILEELDFRSTGFFFQTDILVRTVKRGYLFAEVPYRLGMRNVGISKAVTFPSLFEVIKGYLRLVRDFYFTKSIKTNKVFSADSSTAIRKRKTEI